jgi:hypothetical protein
MAMSIDFDEVIKRMDAAPALSLVAPVRISAHGEDGTVFYGYGGLVYEPPDPPFVFADSGDLMLTQADAYEFEGARLTTEYLMTNGRVRLVNNQAYDPKTRDNWEPPNFQTFLIARAESAAVQIGWASKKGDATNRRLILRVTRGSWPQLVVVDVEMDERGALLSGLGSLGGPTAAIWTVSFLDPIARIGNEIG